MVPVTGTVGLLKHFTPVVERQKGDPEDQYEYVSYDPEAISERVTRPAGKAVFEPWEKDLPGAMITLGRTLIGCSRASTPSQISDFLALFGLPLRDIHGYVAFCAAGISFVAARSYANLLGNSLGDNRQRLQQLLPDIERYYFYPTISCVDMFYFAKAKRHWIDRKLEPTTRPRRGWIVLYDWNERGLPDHCGIIERADDEGIDTLEFNTTAAAKGNQRNGGAVAERRRRYKHVLGFIATDITPKG